MKRASLSHTFINLQWAWFLPVSIRKNSLSSPASHPHSTFAALKLIPLAMDLFVAPLTSQRDQLVPQIDKLSLLTSQFERIFNFTAWTLDCICR